MNTGGARSIGSIETWEHPDKSFSKHILRVGREGTTPNDSSVCTVLLTQVGNDVLDEQQLGGYKFGEIVEITIGEGDTLMSELLDKVVCSMKEGESCYVKSKMDAKGGKVSEFEMTSHSAFKFNVELHTLSRAAECDDLEGDERLERAQHHKDRGTELFKESRVDFATKRYEKAWTYLTDMGAGTGLPQSLALQYTTLKCQCCLNLAAVYLTTEKYTEVVEQCTKVLVLEPSNVKGLFRRGKANMKLNNYQEARADLKKALEIEPWNKAVSNQLINLQELVNKERAIYKKMFS